MRSFRRDDNAQSGRMGKPFAQQFIYRLQKPPYLLHMTRPPKSYRSRKIGDRQLSPETLMMGYGYAPGLSEGALKPPLFQTSTFGFRSAEEGKASIEPA